MSFLSVTTLLGITSLGLYLVENNEASIFYYLPFRLYEFCAGSLIFLIPEKKRDNDWQNFQFKDNNFVFCILERVIATFCK